MSTPSASLEHEMHGLAPHIRVARARACALLLIVSDSLAVFAILAAGGYLSALNTENQYFLPGDHGPAFVPALLVAIGLVLSGLSYYWWERRVRKSGGAAGQQMFLILSLALMLAALVVQTVIGIVLNRGYMTPYHAYESLITLLVWFTAFHLLLAAILGLLLFGRAVRGRLAGHEYLAEASGYWWYYTVAASLLMWLFGSLITK